MSTGMMAQAQSGTNTHTSDSGDEPSSRVTRIDNDSERHTSTQANGRQN